MQEPRDADLKSRVGSLTVHILPELMSLRAQRTHHVYYAELCSLKQRVNRHVVIDRTVLQTTVVAQAGKYE